jgi:hypothetical protein
MAESRSTDHRAEPDRPRRHGRKMRSALERALEPSLNQRLGQTRDFRARIAQLT